MAQAPDNLADQPAAPLENNNLNQLPLLAFNFRPQSFDGILLENSNKWLDKFERYANLAQANNEGRCTLLGLLLTGIAETWFNSLPNDTKTKYDNLRVAFRDKFVNAPASLMQRQLSTLQRVQQPSESVDAYFTEARAKLIAHNFPEELCITLLLKGLRADIQSVVLQHQPFNNVDDLLSKARHIEVALRAAPQIPSPASAFAAVSKSDLMVTMGDLAQAKKDMVEEIVEKMQNLTQREKSPGPVRSFPRRVRFNEPYPSCFRCGRSNHFARNCPFDRPEPPRRSSSPFPRPFPNQRRAPFRGRGHGRITRDVTPRPGFRPRQEN